MNWPETVPCRECGEPACFHDKAETLVWYKCDACSTETEWVLTSRDPAGVMAPGFDELL